VFHQFLKKSLNKLYPQDAADVMPARKRIALVAHDNLKVKMVEWCDRWKEVLAKHQLMGTGTTSKKVAEETGLDVEVLQSGPFGGDQQIGAKISEQTIDILIFFWDPLASMAHDQDVKALFR
jgi:methylglyoxal synthase